MPGLIYTGIVASVKVCKASILIGNEVCAFMFGFRVLIGMKDLPLMQMIIEFFGEFFGLI